MTIKGCPVKSLLFIGFILPPELSRQSEDQFCARLTTLTASFAKARTLAPWSSSVRTITIFYGVDDIAGTLLHSGDYNSYLLSFFRVFSFSLFLCFSFLRVFQLLFLPVSVQTVVVRFQKEQSTHRSGTTRFPVGEHHSS
jgi:hypothetical protein